MCTCSVYIHAIIVSCTVVQLLFSNHPSHRHALTENISINLQIMKCDICMMFGAYMASAFSHISLSIFAVLDLGYCLLAVCSI